MITNTFTAEICEVVNHFAIRREYSLTSIELLTFTCLEFMLRRNRVSHGANFTIDSELKN